jgi:hypothetical protein
MQTKAQHDLLFNPEHLETLSGLADLDRNDSPVVSCYLDTQAGKPACEAFLQDKVRHIRATLGGTDRLEFEHAVAMIRRALDANWRPAARGMAMFARGFSAGRHLTTVHAANRVDNRLVVYRLPELLPLIALLQREPSFTLLLVRNGQMQLLDIAVGSVHAHLRIDETQRLGAIEAIGHASTEGFQDGVWQLRKALAETSAPLIVAGDIDMLAGIAGWLPRREVARLIGSIPIAAGVDIDGALQTVRQQVAAIARAQCADLAAELANNACNGSDGAVLGYRATLEAVQQGQADAVVISDWDQPGLGLPWEAEIELCREALRRRVPVVLADSLGLRESGSVGCRLARPRAQTPAAPRRQGAGMGRVA